MTIPFSSRALRRGALLVLAIAAIPTATYARAHKNSIGSHHLLQQQNAAVVVFGGQPVIPMKPFKVTIYASGKVVSEGTAPQHKDNLSLDLRAVLKLAEAEGFFSMPSTIAGTRPNVDNGPRFITISTEGGTRTVTLQPTGQSDNFNQLYGTLMELVSVTK